MQQSERGATAACGCVALDESAIDEDEGESAKAQS